MRTRRAIGGSDVVFLVLDAMEGVADLDKRLAGEIVEAGAAAIIVVNKWDYAAETFKSAPLRGYENLAAFKKGFEEAVRRALPDIADAPVHFVSAKENSGIENLLESAYSMSKKMLSAPSTNALNSCVSKLLSANPPKYVANKRFKVYYCVKTASRPYTIRMFCNDASVLADSYRRYLVKGLREKLRLGGVSIKLELVGKPKRYAGAGKGAR